MIVLGLIDPFINEINKLNLKDNRINKIQSNTFIYLKVEEINLENNNLSQIYYQSFVIYAGSKSSLKILNLSLMKLLYLIN